MRAFRRAVQAAFEQAYFAVPVGRAARITKLRAEVDLDADRAEVMLELRDGQLEFECSCQKPRCEHAQAALAFVSDAEPRPDEDRLTELYEPAVVGANERRSSMHSDPSTGADTKALAEVLSDLTIAVLRAGVDTGLSPSIEEALQRLRGVAPSPTPLGVSRWVGRLKHAIAERDVDELARVLCAGNQLSADLGAEPASEPSRRRVVSWLGSRSDSALDSVRASDLTLLELAREWLPGFERGSVERRYLLDLDRGRVYREERAPAGQASSLGPCPRLLTVWLANVEQSAPEERIRLLQYAVTPAIEAASFEYVAEHAEQDFAALLARYCELMRDFAGICEPFALLAPAGFDGFSFFDEHGAALPMFGVEARALPRHLEALVRGGELAWVGGRLLDRDGVLGLTPLCAAIRRHGRLCYEQL